MAKSEEEVEIHARRGASARASPGLVQAFAQGEGLSQLGDTQPVGTTLKRCERDREQAMPVGVGLHGGELKRAGGGSPQDAQVMTDSGQVDDRA